MDPAVGQPGPGGPAGMVSTGPAHARAQVRQPRGDDAGAGEAHEQGQQHRRPPQAQGARLGSGTRTSRGPADALQPGRRRRRTRSRHPRSRSATTLPATSPAKSRLGSTRNSSGAVRKANPSTIPAQSRSSPAASASIRTSPRPFMDTPNHAPGRARRITTHCRGSGSPPCRWIRCGCGRCPFPRPGCPGRAVPPRSSRCLLEPVMGPRGMSRMTVRPATGQWTWGTCPCRRRTPPGSG